MNFRLFTVAGIPVNMSIWYLLIAVLFSYQMANPIYFGLVMTLSILVHEFGHALVARHYNLTPGILLHGMGGVCGHQPAKRDLHDILIILAGPGAGFALAGLTFLAQLFLPASVTQNPDAALLLQYSLYVNVAWSIFNMIPLWPLDGGQLFKIIAAKFFGATGEKATHILGMILAVGGAFVYSRYLGGGMYMVFLGLMLAFDNYQRLRMINAYGGSSPQRKQKKVAKRNNQYVKELLEDARHNMTRGDWREGARLAHVAREESGLTDKQVLEIWSILTITAAQQGEYEEALSYAQHAPATAEVVEAEAISLVRLQRFERARELLGSKRGTELPRGTRADIEPEIAAAGH